MIKVIIDHFCQSGKEEQFYGLVLELREMAMRQRGYISGETLRELIDPSHFKIISTWSTLEDWVIWRSAPMRVLLEAMMESMARSGRQLRIFSVNHKND